MSLLIEEVPGTPPALLLCWANAFAPFYVFDEPLPGQSAAAACTIETFPIGENRFGEVVCIMLYPSIFLPATALLLVFSIFFEAVFCTVTD